MYFCAMKIDDEIQSRYTSNFLSTIQNSFMANYGLSMAQFNILRILRGAGDSLAVNTVKERMIEKSPNTTRLMDKLIAKGLITRERCSDDRRVVYIKISKQGLALLADIDVAYEKDNSNFLKVDLTDEEANTLNDLLDKLRG